MSVQLTSKTKPGDLYIGDDGSVHKIQSFCTAPTVTMENVVTGSHTGGGVGCLNLKGFRPIETIEKSELLRVIENLSKTCNNATQKRLELMDEIITLKERLCAVKEELYELKSGEWGKNELHI